MSAPRTLRVYVDGACEPTNPGGTATYGVALYDEQGGEIGADCGVVAEGPAATTNVAEFAAAHRALELVHALGLPAGSAVAVFGDSLLVMRMLGGHAKPKTRAALYVPYYERGCAAVAALRAVGITVTFSWIPREQNQRADALSKQALPATALDLTALPFGKFAGQPLDTVPTGYLRWLAGQGLRDAMDAAVSRELSRRRESTREVTQC
jgi:ribonuclease HI